MEIVFRLIDMDLLKIINLKEKDIELCNFFTSGRFKFYDKTLICIYIFLRIYSFLLVYFPLISLKNYIISCDWLPPWLSFVVSLLLLFFCPTYSRLTLEILETLCRLCMILSETIHLRYMCLIYNSPVSFFVVFRKK